ncbi:Dynein_light domain-containing protein [Cephalotus follicularis]|uniref:Dynein_light domain-containing protein n=1 Tax=Cephalotus follicularis TaxID=3775 RepID=A0A1Q3DIV2_CEPFO|nr:Dynein_light domain-containing protein [Cephalotus follicularis]
MAHQTTRGGILEAPDHPSPPSMDPTLKKHPKPTKTTKNPDPTRPSKPSFYMTNHLSRLNPNHFTSQKPTNNKHNPQHPPPRFDIHLQAKAMTVSADSDSSKFLLTKSLNLHKTVVPKIEKERRSQKETSKEIVKKGELVNRKKKEVDEEGVDIKKLLAVKGLHEGLEVQRVPVSMVVNGGRRRSFYGSQVELGGIIASCGVKIVSVDMPPFMQIHAVEFARKIYDSLEKFTSKALALTLKKEFDGVYGPAWHCIVGTSFGSFVTHSAGGFLYFSMDQKMYILLFKTTVQRAD